MKITTKEDQQKLMRYVVYESLKNIKDDTYAYVFERYQRLLEEVMRLQDLHYCNEVLSTCTDTSIIDISIIDIINNCYVVYPILDKALHSCMKCSFRDNKLYVSYKNTISEVKYGDIINSIINDREMYRNMNEKLYRILSICFDEWSY